MRDEEKSVIRGLQAILVAEICIASIVTAIGEVTIVNSLLNIIMISMIAITAYAQGLAKMRLSE